MKYFNKIAGDKSDNILNDSVIGSEVGGLAGGAIAAKAVNNIPKIIRYHTPAIIKGGTIAAGILTGAGLGTITGATVGKYRSTKKKTS